MSFIRVASKYKPLGLWQMDDTTPLQDYSPYNRVATTTGTIRVAPGLIKGATYAPTFSNSGAATFTVPVFLQGREKDSFTLNAFIYPVLTNSPQKILSHLNDYDGLTVDGTTVSFSTKYLTAGEAKCSYDMGVRRAVHVVGVHTPTKNSLYVDSELVDEVELTTAQQEDSYVATNGNLYLGASAGTGKTAVNGVAMFSYALSSASIVEMYTEARDLPDVSEIAAQFGGTAFFYDKKAVPLYLNEVWEKNENWHSGTLRSVSVMDDKVTPQFAGDTSIAGTWLDSVPLTTDVASIYGVALDWEGTGITVETSLDGTTWASAIKGVKIASIAPGYNPTNKELFVRVSFPGGIVDDLSYISKLEVTGMKSGAYDAGNERTITLTKAYPNNKRHPIQMYDDWGALVESTGTNTLSPDGSSPAKPIRTVEVWMRSGATTQALNFTSPTYYMNGAAFSSFNVGQWAIIHGTVPADHVTNFVQTIGTYCQIGAVTVYDTVLSAGKIAEIVREYTRSNLFVVDDVSVIGVTQAANAADIYAHDWAIIGSG